MKDEFGREITYLRISVTQRCGFRCAYCGAGEANARELTPEELFTLCEAFRKVGITKVRLTGGEPLAREDILDVVSAVKRGLAPETLALTTNGSRLEALAEPLRRAGVTNVNISVDTLDPETFFRLTGTHALPEVLRGLEAALSAGFERVRVNAVLLKNVNDADAGALVDLAKRLPLDVRFIELMPTRGKGSDALRVSTAELLARFPELRPANEAGDTAVYYTGDGFLGRVGFISSVTKPFCGECNRVRLLSDGKLKPCLGRADAYDLLPLLGDPEALEAGIRRAIKNKPAGHRFSSPDGGIGPMNRIGG